MRMLTWVFFLCLNIKSGFTVPDLRCFIKGASKCRRVLQLNRGRCKGFIICRVEQRGKSHEFAFSVSLSSPTP